MKSHLTCRLGRPWKYESHTSILVLLDSPNTLITSLVFVKRDLIWITCHMVTLGVEREEEGHSRLMIIALLVTSRTEK